MNEAIRRGVLKDSAKGDMYGRLTAGSSDMLQRASTFLNCWYQSESESVAMWKVYSGQGIAIQSTVRRLRDALPDSVHLGRVVYIDYRTEEMNPELPYLFKDRIYAYENEIRAFIWQPPTAYSILAVSRDQPLGITRPVNLDRLIKRVYVAPDSGAWFRGVVQEVLGRYGLATKEVLPSIADSVPDYRRLYEETRKDLIDQAYPHHAYITEETVSADNKGVSTETD